MHFIKTVGLIICALASIVGIKQLHLYAFLTIPLVAAIVCLTIYFLVTIIVKDSNARDESKHKEVA